MTSGLIKEAKEIHRKIEKNKKLYARLDEIIQELIKTDFQSESGVTLVDNFKNKNMQWKAAGIRRFDLDFTGV